MENRNQIERQPLSSVSKIVFVHGPSRRGPGYETEENTLVDDLGVRQETTTSLHCCCGCARVFHDEGEIGGVCSVCDGVLCLECAQIRCACPDHQQSICPDCRIELQEGVFYCKAHGRRELLGKILAITLVLGLFTGIGLAIVNLAF